MKELQSPRKDIGRRRSKDSPSSKSILDYASKKPHKDIKEFPSVSEDSLSESVTDASNFSPVSEILSDNHRGESLDSLDCLFAVKNQSLSALEEASTPSNSTASSKITIVNDEPINLGLNQCKGFNSSGSYEAEVVGNLLKQARIQISSSIDIHPRSKKLLDALIEVSVKEFYDRANEMDRIDMVISQRCRILALCFMAWVMISVSMIVFGGFGTRSSSSFYPPPT